jgi:hypothetical protein
MTMNADLNLEFETQMIARVVTSLQLVVVNLSCHVGEAYRR